MIRWIPYAMVRITIFLAAGILLAIYQPQVVTTLQSQLVILVGSVLYLTGYFLLKDHRSALGVVGLLLIFFLGYQQVKLSTQTRHTTHLIHRTDSIRAYTAVVRSYPESKSKSWKIVVEVEAVRTDQWHAAVGRVQVYVAKNEASFPFQYGDRVLISGSPMALQPPSNPGEFDFKRFLSFKNIYHQQFLKPHQLTFIAPAARAGFLYYSHRARSWATEKIQKYISGEQEQAIAMALILGVTDDIDTDLVNAYSASGAMHVLAVSGLHVGIIYALILFLLQPFQRYSWSRWFIAVTSLICLWAFAFVTGLSPSVLRAVTMFSFMAIARPFGIRTNIYNTLAASAFVLLIFNPFLIMSVGFQLSYLAVLGIVYLQRPIYQLWVCNTWITDWVWKITCISIAAQLTTFSLGLLYFHQFPVYFLVSNLFVIPLSTFVLVLGIVLLALQFFSPVANVLGFLLEWLIKALNWIVFQVEALPYSLINNIQLSTLQCWLLMGVLACIILVVERKSIQWLYGAAICALVYSATQWQHFYDRVDRTQLVVYRVNHHQAIDFIHRGNAVFIADSLLQTDKERLRFHIRPNRLLSGVKEFAVSSGVRHRGVLYLKWFNKPIAIIDQRDFQLPQTGTLDVVIVSGKVLPPPEKSSLLKIDRLILDSSVPKWNAARWTKWATTAVLVHSVSTQSGYVLSI